jgi:transcription elongation factor GreA
LTDQPTPLAGASELMRSLDLLVDGPVRWGSPVSGRAPGVFVVELPGGLEKAPIDGHAVTRWLARLPDLRLDGEPTTAQSLGRRLAAFWLPREPILYVGRSAKTVGARVAAMYATPLGDLKPYAAGYWLKALSVLSSLRVWWAATDAYEEYEDALLSEVAARTSPEVKASLPDPDVVLPFANLTLPGGPAKRHGLENALRDSLPAVAPTQARAGPVRAARSRPITSTPRPRRTAVKTQSSRPVPEPTFVSQDGLERLAAELDELRINVRPHVIARVKAARELGDLRENGDYEYARKEQSFVEGRIQTLEALIKASVIIDASAPADAVRLGSTVDIEADNELMTYVLVGSSEASPGAGRLSYASPVGQALIGARAGDEVTAQLPGGTVRYRVIAIR